jgi:hypothetical protein
MEEPHCPEREVAAGRLFCKAFPDGNVWQLPGSGEAQTLERRARVAAIDVGHNHQFEHGDV